MIALIQRVSSASVTCEGVVTASIGCGLLILLGIEEADGAEDIAWLAPKVANLRIFADEDGVMNVSLKDRLACSTSHALPPSEEGVPRRAGGRAADPEGSAATSLPLEKGGEFGDASPSPGSQEKVASVSESDEVDSPELAYPLTPLGGEGARRPSPREGEVAPRSGDGGGNPGLPPSPTASGLPPLGGEDSTVDPHPVRFAHRPLPASQGEVARHAEGVRFTSLGLSEATPQDGAVSYSDPEGVASKHPGAIVVSQFTLHASTKKGNRPSYIRAARPDHAEPLYEAFAAALSQELGQPVGKGVFGGDMKVALVNDGPVTIHIDTRNRV